MWHKRKGKIDVELCMPAKYWLHTRFDRFRLLLYQGMSHHLRHEEREIRHEAHKVSRAFVYSLKKPVNKIVNY